MEILGLYVVLGIILGLLAAGKRRCFLGWTILALVTTPVIAGLLLLLAGHPLKCPWCRAGVARGAVVCSRCGRNLTTGQYFT